jgi:hypothetical protein
MQWRVCLLAVASVGVPLAVHSCGRLVAVVCVQPFQGHALIVLVVAGIGRLVTSFKGLGCRWARCSCTALGCLPVLLMAAVLCSVFCCLLLVLPMRHVLVAP